MRPEQPLSPPVLVVAPSAAPVSLDVVKQHLRVDGIEQDEMIEGLIVAATDHLDGYAGILGRALVTQTWRQDFAAFSHCMRLPLGPVSGAPAITFFDANGAEQTLPDTVYAVHADARGSFIGLKSGQSWPAIASRPDAISVVYQAGQDPERVPAAIKVAIMLLVAHWHKNPEAVAAGVATELPFAVTALLTPLRRVGL